MPVGPSAFKVDNSGFALLLSKLYNSESACAPFTAILAPRAPHHFPTRNPIAVAF